MSRRELPNTNLRDSQCFCRGDARAEHSRGRNNAVSHNSARFARRRQLTHATRADGIANVLLQRISLFLRICLISTLRSPTRSLCFHGATSFFESRLFIPDVTLAFASCAVVTTRDTRRDDRDTGCVQVTKFTNCVAMELPDRDRRLDRTRSCACVHRY